MTQKFFGLLTEIGEIKEARAHAQGTALRITKLAVCDGNGAEFIPDRKMKVLPGEKRRAPLNQLTEDKANPNWVIAEQVIPEDVGGFWIRGYGLFDEDGDLIAVANCAPTYKPELPEGSGRTQVVRMVLMVGSVASYELKIDPSVVLATRDFVETQITAALRDAFFWRGHIAAPADLNNYVDRGAFHARYHEVALQGNNFPAPYAGKLEVWPGFDGVVFQTYHCYDGAMYWRLKYLAWGDWSRAATVAELNAQRDSFLASIDELSSRIDDLGRAVNQRIDTLHQDFQNYAQANNTAVGNKVDRATSVTAGAGLTGGGALDQSRTISLGTPSRITGTSVSKAEGQTHSHAIDWATTGQGGIVQQATVAEVFAGQDGGKAVSPYVVHAAIKMMKGCAAFTASGSFTVPAGVTMLFISGCGAGGGGGAGAGYTGTSQYPGGGGGAGEFVILRAYPVTPGETIAVTVGWGGGGGLGQPAGQAGTSGQAGGLSQFGTLRLMGGGGGVGGSAEGGGWGGDGYPRGGAATTVFSLGTGGASLLVLSGSGAPGPFGAPGMGASSASYNVVGATAHGYGAGGAGGNALTALGTGSNGGSGANGAFFIWW